MRLSFIEHGHSQWPISENKKQNHQVVGGALRHIIIITIIITINIKILNPSAILVVFLVGWNFRHPDGLLDW